MWLKDIEATAVRTAGLREDHTGHGGVGANMVSPISASRTARPPHTLLYVVVAKRRGGVSRTTGVTLGLDRTTHSTGTLTRRG
jgi:hypothetical protein